jgi:hypothetical protein
VVELPPTEEISLVACEVYNLTLQQATVAYGNRAGEAASAEIQQLHDKGTWKGVHPQEWVNIPKGSLTRGFMFLKAKTNVTTGSVEKIKARYVIQGNRLDEARKEPKYSPTVSTMASHIIMVLMSKHNMNVMCYDVPGAYLNAHRGENDPDVHLKLDAEVVEMIKRTDESFGEYAARDGTAIVRLQRALYGLADSSGLWYMEVSKHLKSQGLKESEFEPCVFGRNVNGSKLYVIVYVDDMLIGHRDKRVIDEVADVMDRKYGVGKRQYGPLLQFLGNKVDFTQRGVVKLSQPQHIREIVKEWDPTRTAETPASGDLFECREDSPLLSKEMAKKFHSSVALALYIAKHGPRPDILLPITYLATRVQEPNEDDLRKLMRVIKYLAGTNELCMSLTIQEPVKLRCYVDASYGVHKDGKSHTGMLLTLGKGAILARSRKQKIVVKSSTEAELVAASDEAGELLHAQGFLREIGESAEVGILHQDNTAAISLETKGKVAAARTKHVSLRHLWIKDQVKQGELVVEYTKTDDMLADLLTKPLQGEKFLELRRRIMNE